MTFKITPKTIELNFIPLGMEASRQAEGMEIGSEPAVNELPVAEPLNWDNIESVNKPEDNATDDTAAAAAQALAITKTKCFYQTSIPISISIGDLWIDSDNGNKLYRAASIGADAITAGEWVEVPDQNKTTTFAQDAIPTSLAVGDLWVDTNDENKLYRAESIGADQIIAGEWVLLRDSSIAIAQAAAEAAQGAANDAQGDATTSLNELADIAADDKITPVEKLTAKQLWDAIVVEGAAGTGTIPVQATAYSVADTDFDTVYAALDAYLNTDPDIFDDLTTTTTIVRSEWDAVWKNYYDERTKLLQAIADYMDLSNHEASDLTAARNYDAVVAPSGGDYTNIQAAIDAGKTNIFIRKGTYTLTADITLDSGISLYGEDKYDTIINCNGDHQIKAIGDVPNIGTITITNGDATIVGAGTSWITGLAVNDYIVFNGNVYKITEITDDTHLEIEIIYTGKTESGISYNAGTFKHNINIQNLTIKGQIPPGASAKGVLYFHGIVNSNIDNIIVKENNLSYSIGIYLLYCFNNSLTNIDANNNGYSGVMLCWAFNNILFNINANNNNGIGLNLKIVKNNIISDINVHNNDDCGLYLVDWSGYTSDYNVLSNIKANNNIYSGVLIASSHNALSNIVCERNSYCGIYIDTGNYNTINGCIINDNERDGICIYKSSYNQISNNICKDNSQTTNNTYTDIFITDDGSTYSTYNIISNNNIRATAANKSKYGIRENAASDNYNLIHGNIVYGAVTANISLQGANSVNADNI